MTINVIAYTRTDKYWDMLYYLNEQIQHLMVEYAMEQPTDLVRIIDPQMLSKDLANVKNPLS